ncbi:hypothetical protein X986_3959 [Burkholderia pseudomallei]|uniref:DUF2460 domain-containing protein n=1 Tax=Burkholderia pseudomallei TaxID=28450 RepID=UPI00050EF458|nr:DUF2460 domain-containing protein [Burkholderia pseudomallei]AIV87823.1 hypothetical protein X995_5125 [Burkholderia pseudomallei B03]AIV93201.1 hypothetical protein X996_5963 [Burkholderia pseudomallei A79A]KGC50889.1 hypothetical protein DO66_5800 [Burkholderia pseudomallei]KGD52015.1 hypothetical protein DP49_1923 [Burkholderia pseudomallei]KGX13263.1 hypothetical protein X984_3528 [Burkholderia pseudomallei]
MTSNFLESPRFPDDLAVWARGGVSYNTVVTSSTSGREQRNVLWTFGRGQWDLQNCFRTNGGVLDQYSVQTLRNFFRICKGQAYGFRFRDWTDWLDEGSGLLGLPVGSYSSFTAPSGVGAGVPAYQMFKRYAAPPLADYRLIGKPLLTYGLSGAPTQTTTVYRNGSPVVYGVSPGQCGLDTTTGLVTFVADSQAFTSGWVAGTTTSFSVGAVPPGWAVGKLLYFTGVTGDTGGTLNNQAVAITAISGTTVTVSANTSGDTLGTGTAYMYPQASDSLTWAGAFDTPCRFNTDQFSPQLDVGSGALFGFQSLAIVEVRL